MNKQYVFVDDECLASLVCATYANTTNSEPQCYIQYHYLETIRHCDMCRQCTQFYERAQRDDYNSVRILVEK